jgi:hypothetical protein
MFGEQSLIRGNDILSRFQKLEHDGALRLDTANQLGNDFDVGIVENIVQSIGENAGGQIEIAMFVDIVNHNFFQPQGTASVAAVRSP